MLSTHFNGSQRRNKKTLTKERKGDQLRLKPKFNQGLIMSIYTHFHGHL